jgi:hypothetical protein
MNVLEKWLNVFVFLFYLDMNTYHLKVKVCFFWNIDMTYQGESGLLDVSNLNSEYFLKQK